MLIRSLSIAAASLLCAGVAAGTAGAQSSAIPAPIVQPGACTDTSKPVSKFTRKALKRAKRTKVLRGTARDAGCGLDRVEISVALRAGKKCHYLGRRSKFSRKGQSCRRPPRWSAVKGSSKWSFRLPKKLKKGTYVIRTRAHDFAGNVEKVRSHKVRIR